MQAIETIDQWDDDGIPCRRRGVVFDNGDCRARAVEQRIDGGRDVRGRHRIEARQAGKFEQGVGGR